MIESMTAMIAIVAMMIVTPVTQILQMIINALIIIICKIYTITLGVTIIIAIIAVIIIVMLIPILIAFYLVPLHVVIRTSCLNISSILLLQQLTMIEYYTNQNLIKTVSFMYNTNYQIRGFIFSFSYFQFVCLLFVFHSFPRAAQEHSSEEKHSDCWI